MHTPQRTTSINGLATTSQRCSKQSYTDTEVSTEELAKVPLLVGQVLLPRSAEKPFPCCSFHSGATTPTSSRAFAHCTPPKIQSALFGGENLEAKMEHRGKGEHEGGVADQCIERRCLSSVPVVTANHAFNLSKTNPSQLASDRHTPLKRCSSLNPGVGHRFCGHKLPQQMRCSSPQGPANNRQVHMPFSVQWPPAKIQRQPAVSLPKSAPQPSGVSLSSVTFNATPFRGISSSSRTRRQCW